MEPNKKPNRRELEAKMQADGRMPPGQSLTLKFPVLHYGPVPSFDPQTWDFRIFGEVESELVWNWQQFQELPHRKVTMDLHCVTRWSKFDTTWEGVFLQDLIDEGILKLKENAQFVIQHAENNFTANLPLDVALSETFLMATRYEGNFISPEHGFPVRGLIGAYPDKRNLKDVYLWKGAKWLRGLEFSSVDKPGFWEQAGYHNEGDIWKEERMA